MRKRRSEAAAKLSWLLAGVALTILESLVLGHCVKVESLRERKKCEQAMPEVVKLVERLKRGVVVKGKRQLEAKSFGKRTEERKIVGIV